MGARDMGELGLIKTVLEQPRFTDQILDFVDPSMLSHHSEEFALALGGRVITSYSIHYTKLYELSKGVYLMLVSP